MSKPWKIGKYGVSSTRIAKSSKPSWWLETPLSTRHISKTDAVGHSELNKTGNLLKKTMGLGKGSGRTIEIKKTVIFTTFGKRKSDGSLEGNPESIWQFCQFGLN